MSIAGSTERGSENCRIFGLWLSQWKLAILDCESAKLLLVSILESMRDGGDDQESSWQRLQVFFDPCGQHKEATCKAEENLNVHEQLIRRASLLAPREAKRVLQYLSYSSSLNEDSIFWDAVWKALNPYNPGLEDMSSQFNQIRQ